MSFVLRSPPALRLRFLHSTLQACNRIDPPDPVSQLRPILNNDTRSSRTNRIPHPYSLFEFDSTDPTSDYELQWTLHSQQLDAFNHEFWTDVSKKNNTTPCDEHILNICRLDRVILVSKPEKQQYFPAFRNHPQFLTQNVPSQSSISNGSYRRKIEWMPTRKNGEGVTSKISSLRSALNTKRSYHAYPGLSKYKVHPCILIPRQLPALSPAQPAL
jgi:hypothetical protein